jgi:hypothetical protein
MDYENTSYIHQPQADICQTLHTSRVLACKTSMILSSCLQRCHATWKGLVCRVWLCVWPAAGCTTRHGDTRPGLYWRHDDTGAYCAVPRLCWLQVWVVLHNTKCTARSEVITAVLLEISVFWDVTLCCWATGSWSFKGSMILWNIRNCSFNDSVTSQKTWISTQWILMKLKVCVYVCARKNTHTDLLNFTSCWCHHL